MALEFFSKKPMEPESEVVENEEKARRMAEAEDVERDFLAEFKRYSEDPVAYRADERERVAELQKEGFVSLDRSDDFMHLIQEGVHADDLERLAEEVGEAEGNMYDFEQTLQGINPLILKAYDKVLGWWTERTGKALDYAKARAGKKVMLFEDPHGAVVRDVLQRLEASDDPDVLTYTHLYHKRKTLVECRQKVQAAIAEAGK